MIKLCINTLNSDAVTPEEEFLGYCTRKKLRNLHNWDEWKAGEEKLIDQFTMQGMFGKPADPISIPKNAIEKKRLIF